MLISFAKKNKLLDYWSADNLIMTRIFNELYSRHRYIANGCPRNNEPLNILLTSLSKLIRSGLIFLSKHLSFRSLQEYIFRVSLEHILSSV